MTCKFQSVLFLTDSQSALSILSSAPTYLLPESLWNVWSLASQQYHFELPMGPRTRRSPGNEKADLLAKTGASLPTDAIPSPLLPVIAQSPLFPIPQLETSHFSLPPELPSPRSLFGGTSSFSLHTQWALSSSLPWSQSSFIFLSSQDQSEGEFWL